MATQNGDHMIAELTPRTELSSAVARMKSTVGRNAPKIRADSRPRGMAPQFPNAAAIETATTVNATHRTRKCRLARNSVRPMKSASPITPAWRSSALG